MKDFSFQSLLSPIEESTFLEEYWEKKPLIITDRSEDYYNNLFSLSDVGPLLFQGRPLEDVHLIKHPNPRINPSSPFNVQDIKRLYHDGHTVALNHVFLRHEALSLFTQEMEEYFNYRIGINMYLTPKNSQGFKAHYDYHDVFALQISGLKKWYIYEPCTPLLPHEGYTQFMPFEYAQPRSDELPPLLHEVILKPGDLLYLPRGFVHYAVTGPDDHSLHLTMGVYNVTWAELLSDALQAVARKNVELRQSIPPGFLVDESLRDAIKAQAKAAAQLFIENLDSGIDDAAAIGATGFHNRPNLLPDYTKLFDEVAVTVDLNTKLKKKVGVSYRLVEKDQTAGIELSNGDQVLGPTKIKPVFQFVVDRVEPFTVSELPYLSDSARLVLAKRLVAEKALVPVWN